MVKRRIRVVLGMLVSWGCYGASLKQKGSPGVRPVDYSVIVTPSGPSMLRLSSRWSDSRSKLLWSRVSDQAQGPDEEADKENDDWDLADREQKQILGERDDRLKTIVVRFSGKSWLVVIAPGRIRTIENSLASWSRQIEQVFQSMMERAPLDCEQQYAIEVVKRMPGDVRNRAVRALLGGVERYTEERLRRALVQDCIRKKLADAHRTRDNGLQLLYAEQSKQLLSDGVSKREILNARTGAPPVLAGMVSVSGRPEQRDQEFQ